MIDPPILSSFFSAFIYLNYIIKPSSDMQGFSVKYFYFTRFFSHPADHASRDFGLQQQFQPQKKNDLLYH